MESSNLTSYFTNMCPSCPPTTTTTTTTTIIMVFNFKFQLFMKFCEFKIGWHVCGLSTAVGPHSK